MNEYTVPVGEGGKRKEGRGLVAVRMKYLKGKETRGEDRKEGEGMGESKDKV